MKTAGLRHLIRRSTLFLLTAICCSLPSCGDAGADKVSSEGGSETEAKEMLMAFVKSGADVRTLSSNLRPARSDYESVFAKEFASRLFAQQDPVWENGVFTVSPKPGQTDVSIYSIPTSDIRSWSTVAADYLPGGYKRIKDEFKEGNTVYSFKFVKPGDPGGTAYNGLVFVNGHWAIFNQPFRAAAN
jgi:hypothetical protein